MGSAGSNQSAHELHTKDHTPTKRHRPRSKRCTFCTKAGNVNEAPQFSNKDEENQAPSVDEECEMEDETTLGITEKEVRLAEATHPRVSKWTDLVLLVLVVVPIVLMFDFWVVEGREGYHEMWFFYHSDIFCVLFAAFLTYSGVYSKILAFRKKSCFQVFIQCWNFWEIEDLKWVSGGLAFPSLYIGLLVTHKVCFLFWILFACLPKEHEFFFYGSEDIYWFIFQWNFIIMACFLPSVFFIKIFYSAHPTTLKSFLFFVVT